MNFRTRAWLGFVLLTSCSQNDRVFGVGGDAGGEPSRAVESASTQPSRSDAHSSSAAGDAGSGTEPSGTETSDVSSASQDPGSSGEPNPTGVEPGSSGPGDSSGSTPSCMADGDERCFNGADDDCNGLTDCADPACAEGAVCEPSGDNNGVLVAADQDCPRGYTEQSIEVYQGLVRGTCDGCTCTPTSTQCVSGDLYFYDSSDECLDDAELTGGSLVPPIVYECPSEPVRQGFTAGYRVGAIHMESGSGTCTPGGSATPAPPSWETSLKYCVADSAGTGCQFGHACVPSQSEGRSCYESGSGECPAELVLEKVFGSYSDSRTCGACQCDGAGDCSGVGIQLGSDWSCDVTNPVTYAGQKDCATDPYSPPAFLVGVPTETVCEPWAEQSGTLDPKERRTLCCSP